MHAVNLDQLKLRVNSTINLVLLSMPKKLGYRVWCDKPFQQNRICWKNYPTMCNATRCWLQVQFLFLLWWLHSPSLMVEISTSEDKTTTKIYNHLVVDSINPLLSLDKLNNQPIFAFQILKARLPGLTQHDVVVKVSTVQQPLLHHILGKNVDAFALANYYQPSQTKFDCFFLSNKDF